jgi:threonine dehydrogenase-like Zn-dependent dehydrogenase
MRALLYRDWDDLVLSEVAEPAAGPDEVLVRVACCGICGSELESVRTRSPRRPPPRVMGHEFCGVIEAVGSHVDDWASGDAVISHALTHCGACHWCRRGDTNLCVSREVFGMHRAGAFAERVAVPASALHRWPTGLSPVAASLAEPLANGVNVMRLDPAQAKDRVAILGAGPIGLMCLQAARAMFGSSVAVADLSPERREAARQLGAAAAVDPRQSDLASVCRELWDGELPTYVVDAVGSQETKQQSLALAGRGGTIVWLGLHTDAVSVASYAITLEQKRVLGSYSGSAGDLSKSIALLASGVVSVDGWTKVFPMGDAVHGFRLMLAADGANIKGIIDVGG